MIYYTCPNCMNVSLFHPDSIVKYCKNISCSLYKHPAEKEYLLWDLSDVVPTPEMLEMHGLPPNIYVEKNTPSWKAPEIPKMMVEPGSYNRSYESGKRYTDPIDTLLRRDNGGMTTQGTKSSPDYGRILSKYEKKTCKCGAFYDHSGSSCSSCYNIAKRKEQEKVAPVKPSYDDLYWKYIHAGPEDEFEAFQALIDSVDLNMKPGDGSWVHTPDPNEPDFANMSVEEYASREMVAITGKDVLDLASVKRRHAYYYPLCMMLGAIITTVMLYIMGVQL